MVTKTKNHSDYEFLFQSLKTLVQRVHNFEYKASVLLADAADAITNGFENVFTLEFRIICWAHCNRAIDKQLVKIKDSKIQQLIRFDIVTVQAAARINSFETAIKLLKEKWLNDQLNQSVIEFFDYFEYWNTFEMWLIRRFMPRTTKSVWKEPING